MANVWDAMKKHQAEQVVAEKAKGSNGDGAAPSHEIAQPSSTVPPSPRNVPPGGAVSATNNYSPLIRAHHDRGGTIAEQYRSIRTSLLAQHADQRFCMMVTSSEAAEGKTVTCLNLAMVLAERQDRQTLIVDCDLRRGNIARLLNGKPAPGLTDLLRGQKQLAEVIQPTVYPNLHFVAAGSAVKEEISELIGRPEAAEIVGMLRQQYDYVLWDTPPVNAVSDAGVLGHAVDRALVVVRLNKTNRESADRAVRLLKAANIKVDGVVLTHQKYFIPDYLYRYS